jgi:hypothetical protein
LAGRSAQDLDLEGLGPVSGIADFETDTVILPQAEESMVADVGSVKKNLFLIFINDETVIFLLIEPLHCTFRHIYLSVAVVADPFLETAVSPTSACAAKALL